MTLSPTPPKPRARRLKAAGIAFVPVRTERKRHDGWTPARQQAFLVALYATGVVAIAAKSVGMSGRTAYRLRTRPGAASFAAAWDKLLREARQRALDMVTEAALTDRFVPRTYRGLPLGVVTANNDHMLIAALRAHGAAGRFKSAQIPSGKGHDRRDFPDILAALGETAFV
jgi:hypothetical protein